MADSIGAITAGAAAASPLRPAPSHEVVAPDIHLGSVPMGCPYFAALQKAAAEAVPEADGPSALERALAGRGDSLPVAGPMVGVPLGAALAVVPCTSPLIDPPTLTDVRITDPVAVAELHRVHGPVFQTQTKLGTFIFTSRTDDMKSALLNTDRGDQSFQKSDFMFHGLAYLLSNDNLLLANGPNWEKTHQVMNPTMDGRTINTDAMAARIDSIVQHHINDLKARVAAGQTTLDLRNELQTTTLDVALQLLMGTKLPADQLDKAQRAFRTVSNWTNRETANYTGTSLGRSNPEAVELGEAHATLNALATTIMRSAPSKTTPAGALMAAIEPDTGKPYPEERIKSELLTLMLAGHETTTGLLSSVFSHLARNPEQYQRLQQEADKLPAIPTYRQIKAQIYTGQVVDEALRHDPPVYFLARQATRDTTIGPEGAKVAVPKGTTVIMSLVASHRDETHWGATDPATGARLPAEEFHPTRDTHGIRKFPFGGGVRVCIGQHIARMEAELMLNRFAQAFDIAGLPHPPLEMTTDISLHPTDRSANFNVRVRSND